MANKNNPISFTYRIRTIIFLCTSAGKDTVWSSDPPGCGDLEDLRQLFKCQGQELARTSVGTGRAGAAGGLPSPALTATETRDISILIRGIPKYVYTGGIYPNGSYIRPYPLAFQSCHGVWPYM